MMKQVTQIFALVFTSTASIALFRSAAIDAEVNLNRNRECNYITQRNNEAEDIRFESEDGNTIVELTRLKLGKPSISGQRYRAERLMVEHKGHIDCITTLSKLEYKNTHHNFADSLKGFTKMYRYELKMRYVRHNNIVMWHRTISKFDIESGDIIWGPITVK